MEEDAIVGINPIEDMFDNLMSFPLSKNAAKAHIHACTECYKAAVLIPASRDVDRKKDEDGYKKKIKELSYGFRAKTVSNWRLKNSHKKTGK